MKNISEKGFFHLMSANLIIQVFAFGSQFFVAWWLTPEQLGQIKILQTYLELGVLVSLMGFDSSTLKLCSEKRTKEEILYLYRSAFRYVTISMFIVFPLLVLLSYFKLISKDQVINELFPFFSIALVPFVYNSVMSVYLQARKEMKAYSKIQVVTKFSTLALIVVLTYFFNIYGFIAGFVASFFITHFILQLKVNSLNRYILKTNMPGAFMLHWKYSKYSFMANFLGRVTTYTDVLLMNYFISNRYLIGQYSFALTATLFTKIFTSSVQQITAPYLSEKSENKDQLKKAHNKYYKLNVIVSLGILIAALLIIPVFIKLVFGTKYLESIPFFIILMCAWFVRSIYLFKGYTLFGIGKIKMNFLSSLIISVVSLIIAIIFMHFWGIFGLAFSRLATNLMAIVITGVIFNAALKHYEKDI